VLMVEIVESSTKDTGYHIAVVVYITAACLPLQVPFHLRHRYAMQFPIKCVAKGNPDLLFGSRSCNVKTFEAIHGVLRSTVRVRL